MKARASSVGMQSIGPVIVTSTADWGRSPTLRRNALNLAKGQFNRVEVGRVARGVSRVAALATAPPGPRSPLPLASLRWTNCQCTAVGLDHSVIELRVLRSYDSH